MTYYNKHCPHFNIGTCSNYIKCKFTKHIKCNLNWLCNNENCLYGHGFEINKRYLVINIVKIYNQKEKCDKSTNKCKHPLSCDIENCNLDHYIPSTDREFLREKIIDKNVTYEEAYQNYINKYTISPKSEILLITSNIPQITSNIPQITSNIPQITSNIPQIISNIPQITSNIPQITSNIPQITSNIPQITSNIPQITSNIPQITSNIPQITSSCSNNNCLISIVKNNTIQNNIVISNIDKIVNITKELSINKQKTKEIEKEIEQLKEKLQIYLNKINNNKCELRQLILEI